MPTRGRINPGGANIRTCVQWITARGRKDGVGPILAARQKLTGVRLAAGLALEQEH
jgi:hypothetical protein